MLPPPALAASGEGSGGDFTGGCLELYLACLEVSSHHSPLALQSLPVSDRGSDGDDGGGVVGVTVVLVRQGQYSP